MTFRLLTYNILHGGFGRTEAIASVINAVAPDLVLLQEATDPGNVEKLALATGMAEGKTFQKQSLGYLSRKPVAFSQWIRPRASRHAFLEVVPEGEKIYIFGVHLAATFAAWTEQRRVFELRALLKSVERHRDRFHVLAGDFNTVAPGDEFELSRIPLRYQPFVWLSGGRVRWQTIKTVLDAGYADVFRAKHPDDSGFTLPTTAAHVRLDYIFVREPQLGRVLSCDVVRTREAVGASDHFPVAADLKLDD
jgi:exodeoxyribonuclease III